MSRPIRALRCVLRWSPPVDSSDGSFRTVRQFRFSSPVGRWWSPSDELVAGSILGITGRLLVGPGIELEFRTWNRQWPGVVGGWWPFGRLDPLVGHWSIRIQPLGHGLGTGIVGRWCPLGCPAHGFGPFGRFAIQRGPQVVVAHGHGRSRSERRPSGACGSGRTEP